MLNRGALCRFSSHPMVVDPAPGEEAVRFYAGSPLISSTGYRLGTLCAPRSPDSDAARRLCLGCVRAAHSVMVLLTPTGYRLGTPCDPRSP